MKCSCYSRKTTNNTTTAVLSCGAFVWLCFRRSVKSSRNAGELSELITRRLNINNSTSEKHYRQLRLRFSSKHHWCKRLSIKLRSGNCCYCWCSVMNRMCDLVVALGYKMHLAARAESWCYCAVLWFISEVYEVQHSLESDSDKQSDSGLTWTGPTWAECTSAGLRCVRLMYEMFVSSLGCIFINYDNLVMNDFAMVASDSGNTLCHRPYVLQQQRLKDNK